MAVLRFLSLSLSLSCHLTDICMTPVGMPLHHSMTGSMLNQTMLRANNDEHYFYEKRVLKNELACFKDIFIVFSTKF